MFGGSITGGTINTADGRTLLTTSTGGTLANLQFNGDIILNTTSAYIVFSGTTRFGTAHLQASNTSVRFSNGFTMNDTIIAEGPATGTRLIYSSGGGPTTIGATGVIRPRRRLGWQLPVQ